LQKNIIFLSSASIITMINNIIGGSNSGVGVYEADNTSGANILENNCFYGVPNNQFFYSASLGTYMTSG